MFARLLRPRGQLGGRRNGSRRIGSLRAAVLDEDGLAFSEAYEVSPPFDTAG